MAHIPSQTELHLLHPFHLARLLPASLPAVSPLALLLSHSSVRHARPAIPRQVRRSSDGGTRAFHFPGFLPPGAQTAAMAGGSGLSGSGMCADRCRVKGVEVHVYQHLRWG